MLGCADGKTDGKTLGTTDGIEDGSALGSDDGCLDGAALGCNVGRDVGKDVALMSYIGVKAATGKPSPPNHPKLDTVPPDVTELNFTDT